LVLLQYLAAGVVPVKLPTPYIGLSYLSLTINFGNMKEISAALCLLKSSPNLRKVEISVSTHLFLLGFALLANLCFHLHIMCLASKVVSKTCRCELQFC